MTRNSAKRLAVSEFLQVLRDFFVRMNKVNMI